MGWLIIVVAGQVAESRWMRDDLMVEESSCEATYGFLPCSSNVWGLVFMILVYEILLSLAAQLVANGSNLFFQIIGPGLLGGSVFQLLGTIPQLVVLLGQYHHLLITSSLFLAIYLHSFVLQQRFLIKT